jgi:hypothetical protein
MSSRTKMKIIIEGNMISHIYMKDLENKEYREFDSLITCRGKDLNLYILSSHDIVEKDNCNYISRFNFEIPIGIKSDVNENLYKKDLGMMDDLSDKIKDLNRLITLNQKWTKTSHRFEGKSSSDYITIIKDSKINDLMFYSEDYDSFYQIKIILLEESIGLKVTKTDKENKNFKYRFSIDLPEYDIDPTRVYYIMNYDREFVKAIEEKIKKIYYGKLLTPTYKIG